MHVANDHRLHLLVAHSAPLLAMGLEAALREQTDFEVQSTQVGPATDAGSAVDVLVTDYEGGLRHAAEASGIARDRGLASARVLVISSADREQDVRRALESGVHGYLLTHCSIDELFAGVRTLGRGGRYLCTTVAERMAESLTRETLTAREAEVLALLAHGHCNKSIARELAIAVGTVKAHVKAIMVKLDASSRTQAAGIAVQRGLVSSPSAATPPQMSAMSRRAVGAVHASAQFA